MSDISLQNGSNQEKIRNIIHKRNLILKTTEIRKGELKF